MNPWDQVCIPDNLVRMIFLFRAPQGGAKMKQTGENVGIGEATISMQEAVLATPVCAKPPRPLNRLTVEVWEDYRIFKAAGMLHAWPYPPGGQK